MISEWATTKLGFQTISEWATTKLGFQIHSIKTSYRQTNEKA